MREKVILSRRPNISTVIQRESRESVSSVNDTPSTSTFAYRFCKLIMNASISFVILVIAILAASCFAFQPLTTSSTTSSTELKQAYKQSNDAPPLNRNPPRKVLLMVEPTPFTHVSGYANRFNEMLKFLSKAGDDVEVLTVDSKTPANKLPKEAFGCKIHHTLGFTFPLYNQISLTLDLPEMKGSGIVDRLKPDLIHVTSP